jgi:HEAT repeat protein
MSFSQEASGLLDARLSQIGEERGVTQARGRYGDAKVRQATGQDGDPRAIELLVAALEDGVMPVSEVVGTALRKLVPSQVVIPLLDSLEKGNAVQRRRVVEALGELGDRKAVGPLVGALWDTCCGVRIAAAKALGRIGDRRAVEPLVAALGAGDPCIRLAAASALSKIGPP